MGIFGALTTAVTGLRAQSFALENISGNNANSQTTAIKREDTSFLDLIPDNPPSKQLSGTVTASAGKQSVSSCSTRSVPTSHPSVIFPASSALIS